MRIITITFALTFLTAGLSAHAEYRVITRYEIGGDGGYDYLRVDPAARRLYVSHGAQVEVLDLDSGKIVGQIAPTKGVHGIAIAPELGRGYTSNGGDRTVTMFDTTTLKTLASLGPTGVKPDAIAYDAPSKRIYVCNGSTESGDISVIDAVAGKITGSIPIGGKLEELALDGAGKLFVNVEDKSTLAVVDLASGKVTARWPIAPGEEATGLAFDSKNHRLFAGCSNKLLAVLDSNDGHVVATLPIGEGCDGVAFDPATRRIFASCGEGVLTIIQEETPDKFSVLQSVKTEFGARTIALDEKTHHVFMSFAKFAPPAPGKRRGAIIPGSFAVIVVGE